jgi:hypothetical protein
MKRLPAGRRHQIKHSTSMLSFFIYKIGDARNLVVTFRDPEISRLATSCHRNISLQTAIGQFSPSSTLGGATKEKCPVF